MLEMSEKTLVVQHNAVIEARYRLTVEEQRLIKTLVSHIHSDDEDFKVYEIKIADLARLLDISDTSYYDRVKKVTRRILTNVLCFYDENGNEIQTNWLSSAKYHKGKGVVALRFDPELKPYLLQLKRLFTSYELGNILRLKGMYSIRIYELLKQYERIGRREFELEFLKKTLGIDAEYPQYRDFKKFVLVPAEKEISEKTDIKYATVEKKRGRKVIALVFEIEPRTSSSPDEKPVKPDKKPQEIQAGHVVSQMMSLGVARKVAEELVGEYGDEKVRYAIEYTQGQVKEGKVKSPGGFLVEAVKNGYRDGKKEERKRKEDSAKTEATETARRKAWERAKEQWGAWRNERTTARLDAMDAEALELEKEAWRASLADKPALLNMLKPGSDREGLFFHQYMVGRTGGLGLAEWARAVGFDLSPFEDLARQDGKL